MKQVKLRERGKKFPHIAKLLRLKRNQKGISQESLSLALGYCLGEKARNGQFISNIERGKCNLPMNKVIDLSKALNLDITEVKEAMMKDFNYNMEREIEENNSQAL